MIILNNTSGAAVPTPGADSSTIFANPAGIVQVKHSTGRIATAEATKLSMSGLIDVSGVFVSGQFPGFNGTYFIPTTMPSGAPDPIPQTIVSSGFVNVQVVLFDTTIANGTSGFFTFSGIDQNYDMLEIRGMTRANQTGANLTRCFFNNDTTLTNYIGVAGQANPGGWAATLYDAPNCQYSIGSDYFDNTYGRFAPLHLFVQNYATAGPRKWGYSSAAQPYRYNSGSTTMNFHTWGFLWENTAGPAINMIQFRTAGANDTFCSGSYMQVIGHKKVMVITSGAFGAAGIKSGLLVP